MLRNLMLVLLLLFAATPITQPQSAAARTTTVTLGTNELLVLRILAPVNSVTASFGDPIHFELIKPVKVGMFTVIPAGAIAHGKIALVERARAKGHGGKVGITIEEIQSVTGEKIKLRAYDEKQAGKNEPDESLMTTLPGVNAMLIPIALLMPGKEMYIEKGTRFTAVADAPTTFDFDALAKAQPAPRLPPPGVAELYIYRNFETRIEYIDSWPVAIGNEFVGRLAPGRFIHLRLPPGTYWLHNTAGNSSGEIRIDKEKPKRLFELRVEGGETYYVRNRATRRSTNHMELVNEVTGAEEVADMFAPGWGAPDPDTAVLPHTIEFNTRPFLRTRCFMMENQHLMRMQAQPGAGERKKRTSATAAKQEVDCNTAWTRAKSDASSNIGPVLRDGTPVPLVLRKAISSATAHVGDKVEFETTADIKVDDLVIIPKGATVISTVSQAQPKRHMGRAGKLNLNVEYVQLASGDRFPLRATPQVSGNSHVKAVTGAVAATVFFPPAAPLMLLRHGEDLNLPEGGFIIVFTSGDVPIDEVKFRSAKPANAAGAETPPVR